VTAIPAHLGGYIPGGDESTWFPTLWTWLVNGGLGSPHIKSLLDIGCGEGHSLSYFRDLGIDVLGIDGIEMDDPDIIQHDFTAGPWYPSQMFDAVWCCEFLEHVEERYAVNFTVALQAAPLVLVTHAFPGQGGHHHVNCRNQEYWIGFFAAIGFSLNEELTFTTRSYASRDLSAWNHYLRSGLAFTRILP